MTTLSSTEAWIRAEYGPEVAHALGVWLERAIYLCGPSRIISLLRRIVLRVTEAQAGGGT